MLVFEALRAVDDVELPGKLFWMTAAPEVLRTLFVISLNALLTEKLLPWMGWAAWGLLIIIGGYMCWEASWPMPVDWSTNSPFVVGFILFTDCWQSTFEICGYLYLLNSPSVMSPTSDGLFPSPNFEEPPMSMLCPLFEKFDGSMFSFLFKCMPELLVLVEAPRLQMPLSIYFFWAIPELMLLIMLLTPPNLCIPEVDGIPEPDLVVLSFDFWLALISLLMFASSLRSAMFVWEWLFKLLWLCLPIMLVTNSNYSTVSNSAMSSNKFENKLNLNPLQNFYNLWFSTKFISSRNHYL